MSEQFKLQIGAKRQVTLPARLLELLALEEGSEIQIYVDKEHATLVPMVSVPRHLVSRALLQEMESRRGLRSSDLTLDEFATQIGVRREIRSASPGDPRRTLSPRTRPSGDHRRIPHPRYAICAAQQTRALYPKETGDRNRELILFCYPVVHGV